MEDRGDSSLDFPFAASRLTHGFYDYAVTSHCGLLTAAVEFGFRRELARVTKSLGLSPEEVRAARIAGWVAADREWSNRGLGGFRAWCESDDVAAAKRFRAIVRETLQR
ncbi:MAG: hypothetical protein ACE5NW_08750 [Acidiferrobacterales bacterium]